MAEKRAPKSRAAARKGAEPLKGRLARRDELLTIIAHDLISPLTATVGLLHLLIRNEHAELSPRARLIVETLERSSRGQLALAENIQALSRALRGALRPQPECQAATELLREAARRAAKTAAAKGVELAVGGRDGVEIMVDREQALLALDRLITNAVWFSPRGARVTLRAAVRGREAALEVADTGAGMTPSRARRAVGFMRRGGHATRDNTFGTEDEKGAGLGLAVCRELAEANGGALRLSPAKGKGLVARLVFTKA